MIKNIDKMNGSDKINFLMSTFNQLKNERSFSENIWQDVDLFVLGKVSSYDTPATNDTRFTNVYDDGIKSDVRKVASSYSSLVWQKKGVSVEITPDENIKSQEALDWFNMANERFNMLMDDPRRRFDRILTTVINDGLNHSTMCVGTYEDEQGLPYYRSHKSRFVYFKKNELNELQTVVIRSWINCGEIVDTYQLSGDTVPNEIEVKAQDPTQRNEIKERLHFIIKNNDPLTMEQKPFYSIHILVAEKAILRDSHMNYNPLDIATFYNDDEDVDSYGQSPVMDSIVNVIRNNSTMGEIFKTTELNNRPVMGVYTDLLDNNGKVSMNPGHWNKFTGGTKAANRNPIEVIYSGGDPRMALEVKQELKENIRSNINYSVLMDAYEVQGPMTATEVIKRDAQNGRTLGDPLSAIITDLLDPIVKKSFEKAFNAGLFGDIQGSENFLKKQIEAQRMGFDFEPELIPDEIVDLIAKGKDVYNITYLTPAMRLIQAQEVENSFNMLGYIGQAMNLNQASADYIDFDEDIKDVMKLSGKTGILKSDEEVAKIREARRQQIAEQQERAARAEEANIEQQQTAQTGV